MSAGSPSVRVFGRESDGAGGVYVLRIAVSKRVDVVFGSFAHSAPIRVEPGDYVYTGSAHSHHGARSLASRLIRHATRSDGLPPHPIRDELIATFAELGIWNGRTPQAKKLFWNIDHLVNCVEAEIVGVIALRTRERCEGDIARFLEHTPHMTHLRKGLGAHDAPGNTHLLRVTCAGATWWEALPEALAQCVPYHID